MVIGYNADYKMYKIEFSVVKINNCELIIFVNLILTLLNFKNLQKLIENLKIKNLRKYNLKSHTQSNHIIIYTML